MKVLLIGGSGYIGRYVAPYLTGKGIKVKIYDKVSPGEGYEFIEGDVRDTDNVIKVVKDCEVIVILSGIVGDRLCKENPKLADEVNHIAVANICNKVFNKHIIFMSTCAVYGASNIWLDENSITHPLSVYASTKLNAEAHVRAVGGTVFRLGSVYGVGDPGRIRMDSIVNFLVKKAVEEGSFTIFGAKQSKCIISVKDVAGFIHEAIEKKIQGLFNIATENYRLQDIASEILKYIPARVEFLEALPNDRNYKVYFKKRRDFFQYGRVTTLGSEILELINLFKIK
jgi:nucleoside-diphosphate-sugar epimerase